MTPSTGIGITKACSTGLTLGTTGITVGVSYSGKVSNLSTVPLSDVTVFESHDPDDDTVAEILANGIQVSGTGSISLAPKNTSGDMQSYSGSYTPTDSSITTAIPGQDATNPACAVFKDRVVATGKLPAILGGTSVTSVLPVEASCKLCPDGVCPVPETAP